MFDAGVETTTQSGFSRFFNSMIGAICVAPLLLLGTTLLLAKNEHRDACDSNAIKAGMEGVAEIGCDNAQEGNGKLVLFVCDVADTSTIDRSQVTLGEFQPLLSSTIQSTGFEIKSEMRVCMEKSESTSKKGVGGQKETTTVYTYSQAWSSTIPIFNNAAYKDTESWKANCGKKNEPWPTTFPKSATVYADSAHIGAYKVEKSYVEAIPLKKMALDPAVFAKPSYTYYVPCNGDGHFCSPGGVVLGSRRISFFKTDFSAPKMTVLGVNVNGNIGLWNAPAGWLCSSKPLGKLRPGAVTKEDFFTQMQQEATAMTWLLRIVGFCLAWLAFSLIAGPLGVVTDCIPCVGPCIGDMVEAIACFISIFPACGCTFIVAGLVWTLMRPLFGSGLLLVAALIFGTFAYFKINRKKRQVRALSGGLMAPGY